MEEQLRELMKEVWDMSDDVYKLRKELMNIYSALARKLHKIHLKKRKKSN